MRIIARRVDGNERAVKSTRLVAFTIANLRAVPRVIDECDIVGACVGHQLIERAEYVAACSVGVEQQPRLLKTKLLPEQFIQTARVVLAPFERVEVLVLVDADENRALHGGCSAQVDGSACRAICTCEIQTGVSPHNAWHSRHQNTRQTHSPRELRVGWLPLSPNLSLAYNSAALHSWRMPNRFPTWCGLTAAALCACSSAERSTTDTSAATPPSATPAAPAPALGPGEAMLLVPGGRIWYKVSGTGTGTPVMLIHGGPGMGSFYFKSMEGLGVDRPVVRYDQLGAGKSDRMTDTTLMVIPRYVEELDSLRRTLKYDKVFLNGNSWGTIVAVEYYKAHPDHVAGIIFSGEAFDINAAEKEINKWVATLSDSARKAFAQYNTDKNLEAPAYKAATEEFYAKNVFRRPVKADMDSMFAMIGMDQYRYFQGENETMVVGTLKGYSAMSILPTIKVPVLMTTGEFDELGPKLIAQHAKLIPGAKFIMYKDAAHVTQWDAAEQSVKDAREFLKAADKK